MPKGLKLCLKALKSCPKDLKVPKPCLKPSWKEKTFSHDWNLSTKMNFLKKKSKVRKEKNDDEIEKYLKILYKLNINHDNKIHK